MTVKFKSLADALRPLAAIADAYDANLLDFDGARREWGQPNDQPRHPYDCVALYRGQDGEKLLTLKHAMDARRAIETSEGLEEAAESLVNISRLYHSNALKGDARKFIGPNHRDPNPIEIDEVWLVRTAAIQGRPLLSLADAESAHAAWLVHRERLREMRRLIRTNAPD